MLARVRKVGAVIILLCIFYSELANIAFDLVFDRVTCKRSFLDVKIIFFSGTHFIEKYR